MIATPQQLVTALKTYPSLKALARGEGMSWWKVHALHVKAVNAGLMDRLPMGAKPREEAKRPRLEGRVKATKIRAVTAPRKGAVARFLLTCAQNNTKIHKPLWANLQALAAHYGAAIHVSRFVYQKSGFSAANDKKIATQKAEREPRNLWWDPIIVPFLSDERLGLAPGLVWCGEMNILPTAVRPLSGLESYTGRKSGVFPHVKIAMESIASGKFEPTKFNYTTGTVTLRNYIARKAGLKAEFHHCYGALLVEVDDTGSWWCRQINGDSAGTIHDLDVKVQAGTVTIGNRIKGIHWGDSHVKQIDQGVKKLAYGKGGMLDTLRPEYQFKNDVLDFRGRGHHDIKNPHAMFQRHCEGSADVRGEVLETADFLVDTYRSWCQSVVVDSNHHNHLGRWLREQDGRLDPINAVYWLQMQSIVYDRIASGQPVNILRDAIIGAGIQPATRKIINKIKFLLEGESFILCPDANGGIEAGMHGDQGPSGSRGNARAFSRMGRKANVGHTHVAGILDGIYTAGTCGPLAPDYAHGPTATSHSHVLTYPNGKRAIVTMWGGKYRA